MRTIVHLSDIHFGRFDDSHTKPLLAALKKINPDLIIISGDLTQRARISQFKQAREFLDKLKHPYLVVPGNHDIRALYNFLSRFIDPYGRYKKYISENLEPTYVDDEIAVVSMTTVRSAAIKDGRVSTSQIKKAKKILAEFDPKLTKIIVSHHPFDLPQEWPKTKLTRKAKAAMSSFAEVGVDLYLSGHLHKSSVIHTAERYKIKNYSAIAIQAGTISLRLRAFQEQVELQSFNVIRLDKDVDKNKTCVTTYLWNVEEEIFKEESHKHFAESSKNYWTHTPQK